MAEVDAEIAEQVSCAWRELILTVAVTPGVNVTPMAPQTSLPSGGAPDRVALASR